VELWGARFIKRLISIKHKQWLYRNSNVHHVIDLLSSRQQQELMARIHDFLETKKNSLLEQHKHLMDKKRNNNCATSLGCKCGNGN
jgi:hypothetical protein